MSMLMYCVHTHMDMWKIQYLTYKKNHFKSIYLILEQHLSLGNTLWIISIFSI